MTIDDRLRNWAAALRSHRSPARCRSFEGAYRSPQCWEPRLPARSASIDYPDAWLIEAAWQTLPLPERIVLKGHYCLRWTAPHIVRTIRRQAGTELSYLHFDRTLGDATTLLEAALLIPIKQKQASVRIRAQLALDSRYLPAYNR